MSSEKKTKHSKKWSCSNEQAATKTTATSSSSRYRDSSAKPYYCVLKLLLQSLLLPVPQLLLEVLIFKKIGRMVTSQVQLHSWHEDILGCKGSLDRSIDGDMIYGWDRRTKERVNLHIFFCTPRLWCLHGQCRLCTRKYLGSLTANESWALNVLSKTKFSLTGKKEKRYQY